MGGHFIHFNRRDIRLRFPSDPEDPWFKESQGALGEFDRPRYHITRAVEGPATDVGPGDTIWLVGQLYAPWGGRLPATLDARIDVADVKARKGGIGYRFAAADSSSWFPLTNSTAQLYALESVARGQDAALLWKDRKHPIGQYLQRMRKLASGEILRAWEADLQSRPFHFISYRIRDGSRPAFDCAMRLFSQDVRVFWDRWSLPRRLAERRETVRNAPLDKTIEKSIQEADVVWGIESPLYGVRGSYSARERDLAKSLNKYRPVSVG